MKLILFILILCSFSVNAQDSCITKLDSLTLLVDDLQKEVKYLKIQKAMEADVLQCIWIDDKDKVNIYRDRFNTAFRRLDYWKKRDEKRAE